MLVKSAPRRAFRKFGLLLAALVVIGAAGAAFAYPAVAAIACPQCYGFESLEPGVFVDRSMSAAQRGQTEAFIDSARDRVRTFYGALSRSPRILICSTEACYQRIGGGISHGMAMLDIALFLSPRGANTVIAAHELSHIELHSRLGRLKTYRRDIPQWFDEGVAVVVSDDPRYLAKEGAADRCLASPDGDLPTQRAAWVERASDGNLYAKAACRVSRWMAAKGGPGAVTRLVGAVANGTDFNTAYN
jgi:hypothetical protein